ncbi:MAG TPA: hypothetical protein VH186_21135 [Chloroflexia bacterium]|nr:hypothetical protein [Chloroflexia bacterium]
MKMTRKFKQTCFGLLAALALLTGGLVAVENNNTSKPASITQAAGGKTGDVIVTGQVIDGDPSQWGL